MDISGHMTNKKRNIPISTRPVGAKFDGMVDYDKEPQTTKSHFLSFTWSRKVTWKIKNVFFNSARPMVTKLDRMMACEKGLLPTMATWQHNHMISKKRNICISTRLMATKLTRWWLMIVPWFFNHVIMTNKKLHISNSTSPMDTKLDKALANDMGSHF